MANIYAASSPLAKGLLVRKESFLSWSTVDKELLNFAKFMNLHLIKPEVIVQTQGVKGSLCQDMQINGLIY